MRLRCLVVSYASPFRRTPFFVCATLGLALWLAQQPRAFAQGAFSLTSASFRAGGTFAIPQVFDQGDCKGGNRSPQLTWRDAPPGTRGFAITMSDPDAPGRGWWHWAVAGIPATVVSLPENASASGFLRKLGAVEARNDFDTDGYGGPCPPPGKPHRYVITVYALNTADLRLAQGRPALMFDHEIGTATLGSARMVVNYGR
ncbi:hypothetical protein LMG28727_04411 [Paraburkholderia kirstenboschensis]|uniref:YbhB/YbcL family Raf kinase inhibitor-like protein n=1 Tax=Paraburkholderia kirstenboschensis TaxID=1245436 RepID=UPI000AD6D696|nr:YbhB/YbcL family Raf kinase inhibitor-like protein [Paraburkholderia kirstenboschensis]CAD6545184.1 hypothetical protein LMG28727_04411 [Paraburkholderia kirstenboschensis]